MYTYKDIKCKCDFVYSTNITFSSKPTNILDNHIDIRIHNIFLLINESTPLY